MSKRLHVVSKHQEYGSAEGFNWKFEEFHAFLNGLGCEVEAEDFYADEFECEAEKFANAIDTLKDYKKCKAKRNTLPKLAYADTYPKSVVFLHYFKRKKFFNGESFS